MRNYIFDQNYYKQLKKEVSFNNSLNKAGLSFIKLSQEEIDNLPPELQMIKKIGGYLKTKEYIDSQKVRELRKFLEKQRENAKVKTYSIKEESKQK